MKSDFLIPVVSSSDSAPIVNDVTSAGSAMSTGLSEITEIARKGLVETAKELASKFAPKRVLPDAALMKAVSDPVIAGSCVFVLFNSSSGSTLSARLNTVKIMLSLMKYESNFNSNMSNTLTSTYEGKKVVSRVKGALSFTAGAYDSALKKGAGIISSNRILRPSFDALLYTMRRAGWKYQYGSPSVGLDPNQIIANVGQMALLNQSIDRDWYWDANKGWSLKKNFGSKSSALKLIATASVALKTQGAGRQVLASYYHINGLNAPFLSNLYHPERFDSDPAFFTHLSGIPVFKDFIISSIPMAEVLYEAGVGDVDIPVPKEMGNLGRQVVSDAVEAMVKAGYTPPQINAAVKDLIDKATYAQLKKNEITAQFVGNPWGYNLFLSKVYKIPYQYRPLSTAYLTSGYDDIRSYGKHAAYDYAAVVGQPVFAMDAGPVTRVASRGDSGLYMAQRGVVTGGDISYMHLSKFIAADGEYVNQGDIIALAGNTGHSTGPHLHIQISNPTTGKKYRWPLHISNPVDSINKRGQ